MATGTISVPIATDTTLSNGDAGITQYGKVWKDPNTKTCRIQVVARSSSNIATTDILANVPSGFRPKANASLYGFYYTSAGVIAAYHGTVNTNGEIKQNLGNTVREAFLTGEYFYA